MKMIVIAFCWVICLNGFSQDKSKVDSIFGILKTDGKAADLKRQQMNGNKAPDFKLYDIFNSTIQLSSFNDKIILLEFCGYHCGPCRLALPYLKDIENKFKNKEFEFMSILNDAPKDTLIAFYKNKKLNNRYLLGDREVNQQYNVSQLPTFFVIKNGVILKSFCGFQIGITDVEISSFLDRLYEL